MGFFMKAIKFFTMRFIELILVVALVLLMPSVPPYGQYSEFKITPSLPLTGTLAENHLLEKAEKLFVNEITGPESFADYNGELYFSVLSGEILKIKGNKLVKVVSFANENCKGYHTEPDCGRPLGLAFDKNGRLIAADAYSGIWEIDVKSGKKKLLISSKQEIAGKSIGIPNSIAIAKNGDIYWTDSSAEYQLRDILYSLLADGTGRLFKYTAATKTNEVLIDNLYFANGVHLSENEDFVIVNDLTKSRVLRYYLKGLKKGTYDVFVDGLPGLPDNISSNKKGGFLIGLVLARDEKHPNFVQILSPFPLIRKFIARIIGLLDFGFQLLHNYFPNYFTEVAIHYVGNYKPLPWINPKRATIVEIDNNGNIIRSFHSLDGTVTGICEGHIFGEYMYLGSPYNGYIARVKLSDLEFFSSKFKSSDDITKKPSQTTTPKPITTTRPTPTPKPSTSIPKTSTTTTTTSKPTTSTTPKPTTNIPKATTTTTTPKPTTNIPKVTTTTTPKPTTAGTRTSKPITTNKPSTTTTTQKTVSTEKPTPVKTIPPEKETKPILSTTQEPPKTTTSSTIKKEPEIKQNDKKIKVETPTSSSNRKAELKNEL